jgi:hypothetical protein
MSAEQIPPPIDLKAFVARKADRGTGTGLLDRALSETSPSAPESDLQPDELLGLLDDRAEDMARRMLKMCAVVFPAAERWNARQQAKFVRITKDRFESILAVAALGSQVDGSFYEELYDVGASAARSGTALPDLLVLLRMSRDLVVQNAVELADRDDRHGSFALSLLLTRILPAMDRISDALAEGYWDALHPAKG